MRKWNEKMYERSRADALADWRMQADYDSPKAQMARFKEAGLNPNLIYNQQTQSPSVRSSDTDNYRPEAPQLDIQSLILPLIMSMYDVSNKQASTNLLNAQAQTQAVQQMLAHKQGLGMDLDRAIREFHLGQDKRLADTRFESAVASLEKQKVDTEYTRSQNIRAEVAQASSLAEAAERILSMAAGRAKTSAEIRQLEAIIKQIPYDTRIKKKHAEMWEAGVNPNDPAWQRQVYEWLSQWLEGKKLENKIKDDILRDWKPYTPSWMR